jgi:hypothetical protein
MRRHFTIGDFVHRTDTGVFEMAQRKRRVRRGWSTQDVRELKALARQNVPAKSIGRQLKRTEGAVRQKAFSLGTSLNTKARSRAK